MPTPKILWSDISKKTVWAGSGVVDPPPLDFTTDVIKRQELVNIQTLVTKAAVADLDRLEQAD